MPEPDLSLLFVRPLNRLGARYMVSRGIAAILYGEAAPDPNDVDLVVFLRVGDIPRLEKIFPPPEFYFPPADVIAVEIARPEKGQFNVIHADTGFKADFYTAGRDELNAWGIRNARRMEYQGEPVVVAPPEYVILRKLEYYPRRRVGKAFARHPLQCSRFLVTRSTGLSWTIGFARRGLAAEWKKAAE